MVQNRLFPILLLLLCPLVLAADDFRAPAPDELSLKEVAWAPGAPAIVLDWSVRHDDEESRAVEHVRIKILTEDGTKYGDVELLSIPFFHTVRGIRARSIAPDGKVTEFKGKIYDKVVIKSGGFRMLQKTFTLPNVQPGSIVEYRYMVEWPVSQLRTNRWHIQREIPIRRADFWIKPWTVGVSSLCTVKGIRDGQKNPPRLVKDHFEFNIENVPAFVSEPHSAPADVLKPYVEFFYLRTSKKEEYWNDAAKVMGEAVENYIGNRGPIKKAADELIAGATTSEEKLRRLFTHVQQLRNLSFEPEKTEQEEKREKLRNNGDIGDVLRNRYGYANELNRLFAGLARAAGFEAHVALLSARDQVIFSKELPDLDQLTGEAVIVKVDGTDLYFSPGTPYMRFGLLHWSRAGVPGMRLKSKKEWEWMSTPQQPFTRAKTKRSADLSLVDGVMKGTVAVSYIGQDAVVRRLETHNDDEAARKKKLEEDMKSLFPDGSTVKLTKVEGLDGAAEALDVAFDVEVPNLGTVTGTRALLPISLFAASSKNPFAAETRIYPIFYPYQHQIDDHITLRVPEGYSVESLPKPVKLDIGALRYSATHAQEGTTITLDRSMTVGASDLSAEHYRIIRKFYGDLVAADHDAIVMKKAGV